MQLHERALFAARGEGDQTRFPLDVAERALPAFEAHHGVQAKVAAYIGTGRAAFGNDIDRHADLLRFLNDPGTEDDFNTYFARIHDDANARATLDIASCACRITAHITAPAAGLKALPDPVLEYPDNIWKHCSVRAAFLRAVTRASAASRPPISRRTRR